jgi:hypothetical protein
MQILCENSDLWNGGNWKLRYYDLQDITSVLIWKQKSFCSIEFPEMNAVGVDFYSNAKPCEYNRNVLKWRISYQSLSLISYFEVKVFVVKVILFMCT